MRASLPFRLLPQLLAILFAPAGIAYAATPSGTAVAVIQATSVVGAAGHYVLQPAAPIYMGDRVNTDVGGEAQIKFRDDTRIVVGPGSSLLIDKFVFSDEGTAKSVTINAVRGTFRFITGSSPKNAYLIRTPTATMGLRGTRFDFAVGAEGETRLALYEGGVRFCDRAGRCIDLRGRCDVVVAPPGKGITHLQDGAEKTAVLNASFPYLRSQWGLQNDFRVNTGSCSAAAVPGMAAGPVPPPPPPPAPDCPPHGHHQHHGHHKGHDGKHGHHGKHGHRGGHHGGNNGHNGDGGHGNGHGHGGHNGNGHGGNGHGGNGHGGNGHGSNGHGAPGGSGNGQGGNGQGGHGNSHGAPGDNGNGGHGSGGLAGGMSGQGHGGGH